MPERVYATKSLRSEALDVVAAAVRICEDYAAQGYDLTLRQLYYQFVARGLIENSQRSYKRLGSIVSDARMLGYLDWDHIVDRTRNSTSRSHWDQPSSIIEGAARSYGIDLWANQDVRVEVWVEKEALAGVIERVARDLDVTSFSCRGYVSQSEMWRASQRVLGHVMDDRRVVILHLGDHDPSGIDMTRDIEKRLFTFAGMDMLRSHPDWRERERMSRGDFMEHVQVERIALNMDQIVEYDPPPNPAKLSDSRSREYVETYGHESWELDALPPDVLGDLVREHVSEYRDPVLFAELLRRQEHERLLLEAISENFEALTADLEIDTSEVDAMLDEQE